MSVNVLAVGDRVHHPFWGWGTVSRVHPEVAVRFDGVFVSVFFGRQYGLVQGWRVDG